MNTSILMCGESAHGAGGTPVINHITLTLMNNAHTCAKCSGIAVTVYLGFPYEFSQKL